MTMNLPNKIRIGSADYEVKLVKGLSSRHGVWGLIDYSSTTIELEDTLSFSKLREVLAHEIYHGIIHESGMRDIENEEEMVTAMGPILAMLLRDNDFSFMRDIGTQVVNNFNTPSLIVREEADISKIAVELGKLVNREP